MLHTKNSPLNIKLIEQLLPLYFRTYFIKVLQLFIVFIREIVSDKGLYHNVIMMGDYVFNPLANYRDNPLEIAFEFGKLLGFHGESAAELLQFLKNQNLTSMIGKMPVMLQFIEKVILNTTFSVNLYINFLILF